ncbi:hypothetical protein DH2020_049029 [Rehmannia glutinosa]|uniref:Copper amine oxidase catalytic domain-containing protein n=1 Tax=Rehmannia glutinosa TaxID=99300 RepID=A0ABR0U423_REHGL
MAKTELDAKIQLGSGETEIIIVNPNKKTKVGNFIGHRLVPGSVVGPLLLEDDYEQIRGVFSNYNVWVTPYNKSEKWAGGAYVDQSHGDDTLAQWTLSCCLEQLTHFTGFGDLTLSIGLCSKKLVGLSSKAILIMFLTHVICGLYCHIPLLITHSSNNTSSHSNNTTSIIYGVPRYAQPSRLEVDDVGYCHATRYFSKDILEILGLSLERILWRHLRYHQTMNLRVRISSPDDDQYYLENVFGNCIMSALPTTNNTCNNTFHELVSKLRSSIRKISDDYIEKAKNGDCYLNDLFGLMSFLAKGELEYCRFSNWCSFPIYEVDYGWGNPIWVCTTALPLKNTIILARSRCGEGIEAWVNMNQDNLQVLETQIQLISTNMLRMNENNLGGS